MMTIPADHAKEWQIRHVRPEDFPQLAEIYNHYIRETIVTFEEIPVSVAEMGERVRKVESKSPPWLVAESNRKVLGYAYASVWNVRAAYRHTAESSVYLDSNATGRGLGTHLYQNLFDILKAKSIHMVIGGVSLPNPTSVALHERFGFEKVAHFKQVGYKFDQWIDVGYWQLQLRQG